MSGQSVAMQQDLLDRARAGLQDGTIKRIVVSDISQLTDYWFDILLDGAADDQCEVDIVINDSDLHLTMKDSD